jgi:hypothetical protein
MIFRIVPENKGETIPTSRRRQYQQDPLYRRLFFAQLIFTGFLYDLILFTTSITGSF